MIRLALRVSAVLALLALATAAGPTRLRATQELGVQFGQPQEQRQPPADTIELIEQS